MEEIMARQLELQKQIRQEGREVRDMKANATARSVHVTTGRAISNAALNEHFKWEIMTANRGHKSFKDLNPFFRTLEAISRQTMPVRLKLAKLSKKLVAVEEKWEKSRTVTNVDAVDPVEIKLENQVAR